MATSSVPGAITALTALLQASADLTGVTVIDGPPTVNVPSEDAVFVGWQPDTDEAAQFVQDFAYAGARRRNEEFDVLCYLESWSGTKDIPARRTRAFALLAAVENVLRATDAAPTAPTISNTVLFSGLTQGTLLQRETDEPTGVQVGIKFRIACRARI